MSESPKESVGKQQKQPKQKQNNASQKPVKKPNNSRKASDFPLPAFVQERLALFEELKLKYKNNIQEKPIKITLKDGKQLDGVAGVTTPLDIAKQISQTLANNLVVSKVNGQFYDVFRPLEDSCSLELFTFDSEEGKHAFWHSSAHILGQALERRYNAQLGVGPALSDCFYYDADSKETVSDEHYEEISDIIREIVNQKQAFERVAVSRPDALALFKYNKFKIELINKIPENETVTLYRCGPFVDLCRGPHVLHTGRIKAFKITKNSSAYWMGKAENDVLQRVYGVSFPDNKLLKEWQTIQDEAAARDHRLIGKKQELFFFHTLSPGSCFWLPHGTRIYNKLIQFIKNEYRKRGFQEVITPNVYDHELWNISGHLQNYKDNMFSFVCENKDFALKPMNCPGHCIMFGQRARSYRELPLRVADFGVLHRNELSGALSGLVRVRRFQQDDAHIFCTEDMIKDEIDNCLQFMNHVYGIFGFNFQLELSTRPDNHLGDEALWDKAEKALSDALNKFGREWKLNPGDGAFYGPKIDIHIMDAFKRAHQCATIQLDFNLPERFKLEYQTAGEYDTKTKRPVIIHRAILGSVERMTANLIEHYAGKWPFWLSPRQVVVVPIAEAQNEYAQTVYQQIFDAGFYVDIDLSDKQFKRKIFDAQVSQYNYILVVGKEEASQGLVNVRTRDEVVHGTVSIAEIVNEFKQLEKDFK